MMTKTKGADKMELAVDTYYDLMRIKNISDLHQRLRHIKHFALDMDGTIYKGNTLFPFTVPFLNKLKELGLEYSFLTNNPSKSTNEYLAHLQGMGINARREEIYTSAQATIDYIHFHYPEMKRLFILGTPSMIKEFEAAGFTSTSDCAGDKPDGVIVSFDKSLVYARLCRAAWWIENGLPYIATNPDKICPTDLPVVLVDCGSMCACLEKAVGRKPDVVIGKPDPRMLDGILQRYKLRRSDVAMVGDRIYTDIQLAINAGVTGVLVLSGEATIEDIKASSLRPHIIARDLSALEELVIEAQ